MPPIIKQLITPESLSYSTFISDKEKFFTILLKNFGSLSSYDNANLSPYPIVLDNSIIKKISCLHDLLVNAICQIVNNYLIDREIQELIKLPDKVIDLLKIAVNKDYEIGAIRPDFLIDKSDSIKICEINARFPINGFILSQRLSEMIFHQNFGEKIESIKENREIVRLIGRFFDLKKPISIIKGKERGYDINLLPRSLKDLSKHTNIYVVSPQELLLDGNKVHNGITYCEQFILEVHQEELLKINPEILKKIITESKYFNDIRTIFIAHDKRLLSVLRNEQIMKRYITLPQFNQLKEYIIPTYALDCKIRERIESNPSKWVLKKACEGKGEGMFVSKDDNFLIELKNIFDKQIHSYIVQPYLEQQTFEILNNDGYQLMHLVGIILSFNMNLLGPGFFRGSSENIVNVSRYGGIILTPLRAKK